MIACLIIRGLCLVVELQCQLDIPWRLGAANLSHRGTKAHVWCVELHVVKRIDEVTPELQPEPLRELEVLMQTQVYVGVTRPTQLSELWRAIAEGPDGWVGEVAIIGEPLEAACSWEEGPVDRRLSGDARDGIAIRTRTSTERTGHISGSVNRQRPPGADGDDRANLPASNNGIHDLVGVLRQQFAAANGHVVNGVGRKDVGGIVIARRPFRLGIVNVLPICRCAEGIVPSSIITGAIGHALGVGVRDLILQTMSHLLLEYGLQRVVSHGAVGLRA